MVREIYRKTSQEIHTHFDKFESAVCIDPRGLEPDEMEVMKCLCANWNVPYVIGGQYREDPDALEWLLPVERT